MNDQTQSADLNDAPITESVQKAEPVQIQERIEILDVIRGFALLGIIIANMAFFSTPIVYLHFLGIEMWDSFWDRTVSSFISLFVEGKFYTMFSFLFGLGFVIFYERAKAKTNRPTLLFYRRLFILLLIGLAHAFFIWYGDILVSYALLGLLLPLFFNLKPKVLLIWAATFFLIMVMFVALGVLFVSTLDEATTIELMQPLIADMENRLESSFYAYSQGTFAEIMAQRASDTLLGYSQLYVSLFLIFPLFLLGLYVGKRGLFQNTEANLVFTRRVWKLSFVIGFTMSIVKYISGNRLDPIFASIYDVINMVARILGDTGLSIFYVTSIVLLYQNREWILRLKPLAYVGRMALSNYLFQSIVCTAIFYSYGLALYGQVGPAWGLVLAISIFTVQIFISKYWLERYRFGPMEWVWRSLTYGKLSGMKITK